MKSAGPNPRACEHWNSPLASNDRHKSAASSIIQVRAEIWVKCSGEPRGKKMAIWDDEGLRTRQTW